MFSSPGEERDRKHASDTDIMGHRAIQGLVTETGDMRVNNAIISQVTTAANNLI